MNKLKNFIKKQDKVERILYTAICAEIIVIVALIIGIIRMVVR